MGSVSQKCISHVSPRSSTISPYLSRLENNTKITESHVSYSFHQHFYHIALVSFHFVLIYDPICFLSSWPGQFLLLRNFPLYKCTVYRDTHLTKNWHHRVTTPSPLICLRSPLLVDFSFFVLHNPGQDRKK